MDSVREPLCPYSAIIDYKIFIILLGGAARKESEDTGEGSIAPHPILSPVMNKNDLISSRAR